RNGREKSPYETTGVVVTKGLGITKGLKKRIGLQDDILHVHDIAGGATYGGDELHDTLRSLCLTSTGLTRNDDALTFVVVSHLAIHLVGETVDVGRHLVGELSLVVDERTVAVKILNHLVGVYGD